MLESNKIYGLKHGSPTVGQSNITGHYYNVLHYLFLVNLFINFSLLTFNVVEKHLAP
jgi:hypothetical protein